MQHKSAQREIYSCKLYMRERKREEEKEGGRKEGQASINNQNFHLRELVKEQ